MISLAETMRAIYGAWRLARLDAGGLQAYDGSLAGFWRSFSAAIIVAPAQILLLWLAPDSAAPGPASGRLIAVESLSYVIGWTAFPLAAYYLTQFVDRSNRYLIYITAYNWAQVIEMAAWLALSLVSALLFSAAPPPLLQVLLIALVFGYEWFIARRALGVPGLAAAMFVAAGFVIVFFLDILTQGLLHAPA